MDECVNFIEWQWHWQHYHPHHHDHDHLLRSFPTSYWSASWSPSSSTSWSSQIISNFLLICIMISSASLAAEDPLDANSRRNRQALLLNSCQIFLLSTLPGFLLSTFQVFHFSRLSNQNHFAGSWVTLTTSSQQCSLSRSCWKCSPMVLFKREDTCDHQVWMTEDHDDDDDGDHDADQ